MSTKKKVSKKVTKKKVAKKIDKKEESNKLEIKPDKEVMDEIKKAYGKHLRPSKQVMGSFTSGKFTQADLEYLIKYGDRNKKYDYVKNGRVVYGVVVTDKDQRQYYGQFDLVHGTLVTMEKIDVT